MCQMAQRNELNHESCKTNKRKSVQPNVRIYLLLTLYMYYIMCKIVYLMCQMALRNKMNWTMHENYKTNKRKSLQNASLYNFHGIFFAIVLWMQRFCNAFNYSSNYFYWVNERNEQTPWHQAGNLADFSHYQIIHAQLNIVWLPVYVNLCLARVNLYNAKRTLEFTCGYVKIRHFLII
jgi:hypothetical protein